MKAALLISFVAFICASLQSVSSADIDAISHACMAEVKVTEKEVNEFYSSDAKMDAGSTNMQCHLKCVMEKLGELKNGVLDVENAMKIWNELPELAEYRITDPKVFANCKNEKGANDCETAFKINKCLRKNKSAK